GPSMPRFDREDQRARYCRLMCILFHPWRSVHDLSIDGESWEDSRNRLLPYAQSNSVIANINMLHQCRDSRDD
ncbi:hypothetical protein C8Q76DRAFT_571260, partial [Earliella scabrosa]